jgi:hypothetical protein
MVSTRWSWRSAGADSAFLAWVAHDVLGAERAGGHRGVALAGRLRARRLRRPGGGGGLHWVEVHTDEMTRGLARNDGDRCFLQDALMGAVLPLAEAEKRVGWGSTSTTSVTIARAASRVRCRQSVPAGRGRLHEGRCVRLP